MRPVQALCLIIGALSLLLANGAEALDVKKKRVSYVPSVQARSAPTPAVLLPGTTSEFRGWDYLVSKLRKDGISEREIRAVYQNKRMPVLGYVTFAVAPVESARIYDHFRTKARISLARTFLKDYRKVFDDMERRFHVNRRVVVAVLLIETHLGQVTGQELVINRLSRLASVGAPDNLHFNFGEQLKKDPTVTFQQVVARAKYLEETFYPEVPALFEIARKRKISPLDIKGSSAGAFGLPQFLPSSYLRFALDGNKDRVVSLFNRADAIVSTANFLRSAGWSDTADRESQRTALWQYNKSDAYIDAVLEVAAALK
jgi:membrane-bound lytic murein transglycosylase B